MSPRRIISLVPSLTELLADLGLHEEVVGITKFCIHPNDWFRTKTRVGGTKQVKMDIIHQLQPDLIIANKEENVKEQVEELAKHYPVHVTDVSTFTDAIQVIFQVATMTGRLPQAQQIVERIKTNYTPLKNMVDAIDNKPKTCYLIWQDPYMTVGGDTFIHSMMELAGFDNIFARQARYPELTIEDLKAARCEVLILSSEPFPFKEKHAEQIQKLLPATKVILADGEMFSWYGSRLQYAFPYFRELQASL